MFNFLRKNSQRNMQKSLNKYSNILSNDMNLIIRTKYNSRFYESHVEYLDNKEVIFRCPIDKYELIRYSDNRIIPVEFISDNELYITEILITKKIIKDNVIYYKGEISAPLEKNKRRKNYRFPIALDLSYTLLPTENKKYNGNTLDISIDGMLMETSENIYKSKKMKIMINIEGKVYTIKSIIINKRLNYKKGTYLYNLKFDGLPNRHKNEIGRFIKQNVGST